jgi:hypothetical protein
VLASVVEIEMPADTADSHAAPSPAPPAPVSPAAPPATCSRLPADASHGKKCKFFVYDSTLSGALGTLWQVAAFGDAVFRPSTYVIPSGQNMEQALENLLSTYAAEGCDCTDEVQFWSHGSTGNGGWIAQSSGGHSELNTASFDIDGLERFGDDTKQPGYREWHDKLTSFQRRLVLLRRTICDSDSTIYYRSCEAFHGASGQKFAKASSKFWRCDVSGHTKSIGVSQPGKHTLSPCQEPDWSEAEGSEQEGKKNKDKLRNVKPK